LAWCLLYCVGMSVSTIESRLSTPSPSRLGEGVQDAGAVDVYTVLTVGVVLLWIVSCVLLGDPRSALLPKLEHGPSQRNALAFGPIPFHLAAAA